MYEREPKPRALTDPAQQDAWGRTMVANEWFDGEDGIAYGAQVAFLREWRENAPAQLTVYPGYGVRSASVSRSYFATYRAAWRAASAYEPELATVIPVSRVPVTMRDSVPVEFRPAKWPESRW